MYLYLYLGFKIQEYLYSQVHFCLPVKYALKYLITAIKI